MTTQWRAPAGLTQLNRYKQLVCDAPSWEHAQSVCSSQSWKAIRYVRGFVVCQRGRRLGRVVKNYIGATSVVPSVIMAGCAVVVVGRWGITLHWPLADSDARAASSVWDNFHPSDCTHCLSFGGEKGAEFGWNKLKSEMFFLHFSGMLWGNGRWKRFISVGKCCWLFCLLCSFRFFFRRVYWFLVLITDTNSRDPLTPILFIKA